MSAEGGESWKPQRHPGMSQQNRRLRWAGDEKINGAKAAFTGTLTKTGGGKEGEGKLKEQKDKLCSYPGWSNAAAVCDNWVWHSGGEREHLAFFCLSQVNVLTQQVWATQTWVQHIRKQKIKPNKCLLPNQKDDISKTKPWKNRGAAWLHLCCCKVSTIIIL